MSPVVRYGDGTLYGAVDAFYGRISSELLSAQTTQVRETGLKVSIIDERSNRWETANSEADQNPRFTKVTSTNDPKLQTYWAYRSNADVCILDNGTIVRVRHEAADLGVYIQTITDPTVEAQWQAWTLHDAGPNYGCAIAPDGAGYVVYLIRSDGVYRNGVLAWAKAGVMNLQLHRDSDGRQVKDKMWVKVVRNGSLSAARQRLRRFDLYYSTDISSIAPVESPWNWVWYRHDVASIDRADGLAVRIVTLPLYAPEAINSGESITSEVVSSAGFGSEYSAARLVRGLPGQIGNNTVSNADIYKASDGYLYMFYVETHIGPDAESVSNLETPIVWQRSKDGLFWSEPVHVGFSTWTIAGAVEKDGWLYVCGNKSVYRRPTTPVVYDVSNFIPSIEWDSPRENQTGRGSALMANPEDINSPLIELADRRIIIEPGMKTGAGYEYARLDDFWVSRMKKAIDGETNRITIDFANIWARLENPMRDVINFIGKTDYRDWASGLPNEAFSYYFEDGEGSTSGNSLSVTTGTVLWTGWKGLNPYFHFSWGGGPITAYLRYVDENNHLKLEYDGTNVTLTEVEGADLVNGSSVVIGGPTAVGAVTRLGIRSRWKAFDIYTNGVYVTTYSDTEPVLMKPGYVGWSSDSAYLIWSFDFEDLEYDYHSEDLIRQALAMGDYHDVKVGGTANKQYAITWGPQTDLPSAADGLRQVLEGDKLELIWRDGFVEVGQFKDVSIYKEIEDRIIDTEFIQSGNRRINLANVDGNEHTWFEVDSDDARARDRMINAYFDLPELLTKDAVRARALEEIRRSKLTEAPGGRVPMFFDLWRMDAIRWIDNAGNEQVVRIEGIKVEINQGRTPSQRETLDTSIIE